MKLSFGMIFSIILIIIFVSFSVYAIQKFLDIQNSVQVVKFTDDFQNDINQMWKSSKGSQIKEYTLPKGVDFVCLADYSSGESGRGSYEDLFEKLKTVYYEDENLFFYPVGSAQGFNSKNMENIDLEAIVNQENPFCIKSVNGKVSLIIKKDFSEVLVNINRVV